jgi:DNA-binding response OmpR family regulator
MTHTLLIVDDNAELADRVRTYLKPFRYDVAVVCNGHSAVNYMASHPPVEAILLEVKIQGMDGWEICRRLRKITDAPILILTTLRHASEILRALELGADDFLTKPIEFAELKARVDACLRRARARAWLAPRRVYSDGDLL